MDKYLTGDEVYWTDPSGESSGIYEVIQKVTDDIDGLSIYLITDNYSDVEVYEKELK